MTYSKKELVYNKHILFNLKFYGSQNCRFFNTNWLVTTKFVPSHMPLYIIQCTKLTSIKLFIFRGGKKTQLESYASLTNSSEGQLGN
jgi:hypothetical protein